MLEVQSKLHVMGITVELSTKLAAVSNFTAWYFVVLRLL